MESIEEVIEGSAHETYASLKSELVSPVSKSTIATPNFSNRLLILFCL